MQSTRHKNLVANHCFLNFVFVHCVTLALIKIGLPRDLWLDYGITSDSYRASVLAHLRADKKPAVSLPFKKAENEKKGRFGGLIRVAERLAREGFLGFRPFFLFPVVSSLGSMNTDMTRTEMNGWG